MSQDEKKIQILTFGMNIIKFSLFFVKRWLHKNQFDDLQNKKHTNLILNLWIYNKNTTLEIENEVKEYLNNDKRKR